ncbi:sigma-70 family RNA polymerase sigma factor [Desulforamulus ruminis]|uniref:sigma-70 family RNA polymerase sigma factor n=1 Tax=Desulforamulus ruminis TaxID=1564 RepID=UPI00031C46F6|nr:sigma-70 family RNA polymerase sigma factor [Desulforamulus ruminis]
MGKHPLFEKVETLLRDYNSMKARVKNLEIDIQLLQVPMIRETPEETLEGVYFARSLESRTQSQGWASDKTSQVAFNYLQANEGINREFEQLRRQDRAAAERERNHLIRLLQKMDNALSSLNEKEQVIIKGFYIDNLRWFEVAEQVMYEERHCKRVRDRAINYMAKSLLGFENYHTA